MASIVLRLLALFEKSFLMAVVCLMTICSLLAEGLVAHPDHRGVTGPGSLTPTPPPPRSLEIERKVPDHRRPSGRKQFLLDVAKGENVFSPHVSYSIFSEFFRRIQKWAKTRTFQSAQNQYPIFEHQVPEMAAAVVGGTLHLQLESRGFNSRGGQK